MIPERNSSKNASLVVKGIFNLGYVVYETVNISRMYLCLFLAFRCLNFWFCHICISCRTYEGQNHWEKNESMEKSKHHDE